MRLPSAWNATPSSAFAIRDHVTTTFTAMAQRKAIAATDCAIREKLCSGGA